MNLTCEHRCHKIGTDAANVGLGGPVVVERRHVN